jgi:hypothetical protein
MQLQDADIVFVESDGLIAYLIRKVQQRRGEERSYINHVALVCKGDAFLGAEIVDAQPPRVAIRTLSAYMGQMVAVYRPRKIDSAARFMIATRARRFDGRHYGMLKIALHALGLRAFACVDRWPICSYTVAVPYSEEGYSFGAVGARAADPDDIWDFVRSRPDLFECVRQLSILEAA